MTSTLGAETRALVTGATGFIGQRLVPELLRLGASVWAGVLPEEDPALAGALPPEAEQLQLDVRDPHSVTLAVTHCNPDLVFHLAAAGVTAPETDPRTVIAVNVNGTVNVLEALRGQQTRRIVLTGTCYEYGARQTPEGLDPFNSYAASKVAAWAFAHAAWHAFGLPVVTARLFQVYGPGQPAKTLVPSAAHAALAGDDFQMTAGEQERDFVYVDDVVEGLVGVATAESIEGTSVDLGTGRTHTVRAVVEFIWTLAGARGQIHCGALDYRRGEPMRLVADASRTARLTGWKATTELEDGLRTTMEAARHA